MSNKPDPIVQEVEVEEGFVVQCPTHNKEFYSKLCDEFTTDLDDITVFSNAQDALDAAADECETCGASVNGGLVKAAKKTITNTLEILTF